MKMVYRMMMFFCLAAALLAQAPAKGATDPAAKKEAAENQESKPIPSETLYKLSFVISETEDGKRVNQRDYILIGNPNSGPHASVRVGTRVPIYSEEKKVQY